MNAAFTFIHGSAGRVALLQDRLAYWREYLREARQIKDARGVRASEASLAYFRTALADEAGMQS